MIRRSIALAGYPGTGKTEIAEFLSRDAGFLHLDVAELLQGVLRAEGVAIRSRADIGPLFLQFHGPRDIYRLIAARLDPRLSIVVDAVRLFETASLLKTHDLELWYVEAPEDVRVARLRERLVDSGFRGREVDECLDRYDLYNGHQDRIRAVADMVIANDGSFEDLRRAVGETLWALS